VVTSQLGAPLFPRTSATDAEPRRKQSPAALVLPPVSPAKGSQMAILHRLTQLEQNRHLQVRDLQAKLQQAQQSGRRDLAKNLKDQSEQAQYVYKNELADLQSKLQSLKQGLYKQVGELHVRLEERNVVADPAQEVEQLKQQLQRMTTEKDHMSNQLTEKNEELKAKIECLAKKTEEESDMKKELLAKDKRISELVKKVEIANERNSSREPRVNGVSGELSALKEELKAAHKLNQNLRTQITTSGNKHLQKSLREKEELEHTVQQLRFQQESLHRRLAQMVAESDWNEHKMRAQMHDLSMQVEVARAERTHVRDKLHEMFMQADMLAER